MRKRKREDLIPIEESRRVIHLERRGRKNNHMPYISMILIGLGLISILYCAAVGLFLAHGTRFYLFWGALGLGLAGVGALLAGRRFREWLPGWVKAAAIVIVILGGLLFLAVEGLIISKFGAEAPAGADYLIVLGAQWKEDGPSVVLRLRLEKALEYLARNPETKVIVSGGQGPNEPIPEAEGMRSYLEEHGISPERILTEPESENTYENLMNCAGLLDKTRDTVAIVTNNFHVYRALGIARKAGYEQAYGLAASSTPVMLPNNLAREFLAVLKNIVTGRMVLA